MACERVLLDARIVGNIIRAKQTDGQVALLLMLSKIGELSVWICSSQLSILFDVMPMVDEDKSPCGKHTKQCRGLLRRLLKTVHIAMIGESETRAALAGGARDLNAALMTICAQRHRAIAVVVEDENQNSPEPGACHEGKPCTVSGLFEILERRHGVTYAFMKW